MSKIVTQNGMSHCTVCHSSNVRWAQNKAGKWYVADIDSRGRLAGPHFKTCERRQKANAAM
ncbi:hypothetical protein SEA_STEAMEDHAMS_31 [Gordonia phage SteamedHams]|nr:hypothetical protein SEA_STEAMEDHAMS_31 [Gordonia phage SteamedHams]QWY82455.1 hypothetical protein SEA_TOLLS_31 [Gordonia phage Tolls]